VDFQCHASCDATVTEQHSQRTRPGTQRRREGYGSIRASDMDQSTPEGGRRKDGIGSDHRIAAQQEAVLPVLQEAMQDKAVCAEGQDDLPWADVSSWQSAISTVSPGHREGSMLSPRTCRRKRTP
jgi:hypothetical protein